MKELCLVVGCQQKKKYIYIKILHHVNNMIKHTVKGQVWANWKGQNSSLHEDVSSLFALEAAVAYSLLFALITVCLVILEAGSSSSLFHLNNVHSAISLVVKTW